MKLNLSPDLVEIVEQLKTQLPEIEKKKVETRERLRTERQCTGTTAEGLRCRAWAVYGNLQNRCIKHGGAETAKIPRSERHPACICAAYAFPHRQRGGLCIYPEPPARKHQTAQGQRRHHKRTRKTKMSVNDRKCPVKIYVERK